MRVLERHLRRLEVGLLLPPAETEKSRRLHEVVQDIRRRRVARIDSVLVVFAKPPKMGDIKGGALGWLAWLVFLRGGAGGLAGSRQPDGSRRVSGNPHILPDLDRSSVRADLLSLSSNSESQLATHMMLMAEKTHEPSRSAVGQFAGDLIRSRFGLGSCVESGALSGAASGRSGGRDR
jgi:hypothetical protein